MKLLALLSYDFKSHYKNIGTPIYSLVTFYMSILAVSFAHDVSELDSSMLPLIVSLVPLCFVSMIPSLIRGEINNGVLEFLLVANSSQEIFFSKLISLFAMLFFPIFITSPIIALLYNISLFELLVFLLCLGLMIMVISALNLLISCVQGYFKAANNIITIFIVPFIIPFIIISSLVLLSDNYSDFLLLILGMNFILIPIISFLGSYLIRNIYNI